MKSARDSYSDRNVAYQGRRRSRLAIEIRPAPTSGDGSGMARVRWRADYLELQRYLLVLASGEQLRNQKANSALLDFCQHQSLIELR